MNKYLKLSFTDSTPNQQEILIAELTTWPFEGFEQQDQQLDAYIAEVNYNAPLEIAITTLESRSLFKAWTKELLAPQNWNARWESDYAPVIVDNFCAIRAAFHTNITTVRHEVVITPKMSFGTGHHATTYMMVQSMRNLSFQGKKVFDYGCGTAVLAILAIFLEAESCLAIDNDYWAFENSLENCQLNKVAEKIIVQEGDLTLVPSTARYDVILANINRNVILDSMSSLAVHLTPTGQLLCSGFLEEDIPLIKESAITAGLHLKTALNRDKWQCLTFEK